MVGTFTSFFFLHKNKFTIVNMPTKNTDLINVLYIYPEPSKYKHPCNITCILCDVSY